MATCIEAVATAHPSSRLFGRGALHLSDVAARRCLLRSHHDASELDMIVNVGLYSDHAVAEPARAALIQEDIHANPGSPPEGGHGTFSFDLADGGCGVLTAARVLDGFVSGSVAKLALVVAADCGPAAASGYAFAASGGAMLLSRVDGDAGFRRFHARTFLEDSGLFEVRMRWDPDAGTLRHGRHVLEVLEAPAFAARCVAHGVEVAREIMNAEGIGIGDVDALVASQFPRTFASEVGRALGLPAARIPHVGEPLAHAHTAGPLAALEAAWEASLLRGGYTLFLTAGAGLSISAALYR